MTDDRRERRSSAPDQVSAGVGALYALAALWVIGTIVTMAYGSSHSISLIGFVYELLGGFTAAAFCAWMASALASWQGHNSSRAVFSSSTKTNDEIPGLESEPRQ